MVPLSLVWTIRHVMDAPCDVMVMFKLHISNQWKDSLGQLNYLDPIPIPSGWVHYQLPEPQTKIGPYNLNYKPSFICEHGFDMVTYLTS